ncbi:hypothetical protein BV25DRAFT_705738 [Artomyces pyxidatus]|uniref:Uncharacterized protein n=1 Tax=Artomyces pyxidatus TaxID=48021 RepID=A0ACB8SZ99_9AGAM|nr:hypothetical protein BV25DRAFT_705738 [Artomyces pyxidatus]
MGSRWENTLEGMIRTGRFDRDVAMKVTDSYLKITKADAATVPCSNCSKHDRIAHHGGDRKSLCDACASGTLRRCSRCQGVSYCSKECQKAHWKEHRLQCETFVEARAENKAELGKVNTCWNEFHQWCDDQLARELYRAVKELAAHPSATRVVHHPPEIDDQSITGSPHKFVFKRIRCVEPTIVDKFLSECEARLWELSSKLVQSTLPENYKPEPGSIVEVGLPMLKRDCASTVDKQRSLLAEVIAKPGQVAVVAVYDHPQLGPAIHVKSANRALLVRSAGGKRRG